MFGIIFSTHHRLIAHKCSQTMNISNSDPHKQMVVNFPSERCKFSSCHPNLTNLSEMSESQELSKLAEIQNAGSVIVRSR